MFIGHETKTHFFPTKKSLRSAPSYNNILLDNITIQSVAILAQVATAVRNTRCSFHVVLCRSCFVDQVEANSFLGSASAQFDELGSSGALDDVPIVATAEKVNKWNKNTLVWFPRARRTLILDELLPAALSAPSAATELLPQSAATAGVTEGLSVSSATTDFLPQSAASAEVQPASGSNPARLPCVPVEPVRGPHPAWLERWILFEQALAKEAQEWEWVTVEDEEKEKVVLKVNSNLETEHVTNLAMLARLHGLEESNLMYWIFEFWGGGGSYACD